MSMGDRADGKPGLAQLAIDAVTAGKVRFHPERYAKSYLDWLGEKRDWCISRQLWWGHRIPVWRLADLTGTPAEIEAKAQQLARLVQANPEVLVLADRPAEPQPDGTQAPGYLACVAPGHDELERALEALGFAQDPDVLDTWFSSALWPHSTLGWPEPTPELAYYYPTSVLVTSRDIITLWVARMVLTGLYNLGDVPFADVYITPKILDGFGETMSKTKGNGVDPLDIIGRYGADALRFEMVRVAGDTQDARLPVANVCPYCDTLVPVKQEHLSGRTRKLTCPNCKKVFRPGGPWAADDPELPTARQASERFELGHNFANKLWNAARFLLMNLDGYTPGSVDPQALPIEDRWVLSRLATTVQGVTQALEGFRFAEMSRLLYDFSWSDFWRLVRRDGQGSAQRPGRPGGPRSACSWACWTRSCAWPSR